METINLNKKVYAKSQYEKVINTKFSQLATTIVPPTDTQNILAADSTVEVNKFFDDYNRLFYVIPKNGETNSHEYLIKTSTEYIAYAPVNNDIQALIEEINQLQRQNLELNQQIVNLTISSSQQI